MTDLTKLSRRVSEAEGPSRELDAEIAAALGWGQVHVTSRWPSCPPYTSCLTTVIALIAKNLPDYDFIVGRTNGGLTIHAQCGSEEIHFGNTPELALLSAVILAIHKNKVSSDD